MSVGGEISNENTYADSLSRKSMSELQSKFKNIDDMNYFEMSIKMIF